MILKNKTGGSREVSILFETEKNKKRYVVYKDITTGNVYGGRYSRNTIKTLEDSELDYLESILEKIEG